MSTRATYSFNMDQYKNDQFIFYYIHCDNYPEGAATYLLELYNVCRSHKHLGDTSPSVKWDTLANGFLVANPHHVEFTTSHERHSDTEYRYHIDYNGMMRAEKVSFDTDEYEYVEFFRGHYTAFINTYYPKKEDPSFQSIYQFDLKAEYRNEIVYLTKFHFEEILKEKWLCALGKLNEKIELKNWINVYRRTFKKDNEEVSV